jgi:hypothetical protein
VYKKSIVKRLASPLLWDKPDAVGQHHPTAGKTCISESRQSSQTTSVVLHAIRYKNRVFLSMTALQIRAIAELLLWFAPCPEQKAIGFICTVKRESPH